MGIRADVQTDLAAEMDDADSLGDAVSSFTATRTVVTSDTIDPVTGSYPTATTAYSGRGVFGSYTVQEVDGQHILRTDVRLTALQNEVTKDSDGSAYAPAVDDVLAGYDVVNVEQDPTGAIWEVQLRRT